LPVLLFLEDVSPDMAIAKEEIFGPVMSIMRAKDLDAAIESIDANPYGNGASIFTSYGKAARESEYRVKAGNIGINVGVVAPMAFFAMQESWKVNIRRVK
jgi:malonate-semialdehyde dehydrogenase (acetylating)/methylmalonate-semialdehyde dehydrogenase